jgi:hypothetical protein
MNLSNVERCQPAEMFVRYAGHMSSANVSSLLALLNMAPSAFAGGDIVPLPPIKSLSALRKEVERQFPKLSGQDLEALVGWFNRNFFRLED